MNNTIIRSLSGAIFLVIVIGFLLWSPVAFAILLLFSILVMTKEFLSMSLKGTYRVSRLISLATSFLLFLLFFLYFHNNINIKFFWLLVFPTVGMLISVLYEKDNNRSKKKLAHISINKTEESKIKAIENNNSQISENENKEAYLKTGFLIMAPLYIALPFSIINTILFNSFGSYTPYTLLSMFIILWSCDVGAYVFGITLGQKNGHKLFPSISPKKSWEGFFGGLISALVSGIILYYVNLLPLPLIHVITISALIFVFGVFGDLVESLFKRNFGVKDSGNIMPGHGGLLDRFDSALLAFPVAIAYLKIFELV